MGYFAGANKDTVWQEELFVSFNGTAGTTGTGRGSGTKLKIRFVIQTIHRAIRRGRAS